MEMERFKGKKILIVGIGKTGFSLINFFSSEGYTFLTTSFTIWIGSQLTLTMIKTLKKKEALILEVYI